MSIKDTLSDCGLLQFATVNKIYGKAKQVRAYTNCLKNYSHRSKWLAFIDVDEFIVPKVECNLQTFLKTFEPYGGLAVNWQVFGSSHYLTRPEGSQLENFTLRAVTNFHINDHIKCIVQPELVLSVANTHRFNFKDGYFCVNENFEKVDAEFSKVSVDKIQLNHYYCRSLEEYQDKINRGLGDTRRKRTIQEFHHHNDDANAVRDTTILNILKR